MDIELFAYNKKNEGNKENYIDVNNAGFNFVSTRSLTGNRPNGRNDWQLLYVHKGAIRLKEDGKNKILEAGHFIIYKPLQPQFYTFMSDPESEIYWLHFNGVFCEQILKELNLLVFYGAIIPNPRITNLWKEIIDQLKNAEINYKSICNYKFLEILTTLSTEFNSHTEKKENARLEKIKPAITAIKKNFNEKYTLDDLAALCFISKFTLIKIFSQTMGASPIAYLNSIRLKNALYFLTETTYTIDEISQRIGFDNSFYFSRLFKKKYGISPTEYRKKYSSSL